MLRTASTKFLLILALSLNGLAQTGSQITGEVTDNSGASIAGAKVIATNSETQVARETSTNASGTYNISLLQPGKYVVTVAMN